jgi:demethylmenaquinone methyltransferase/2-methoxy-6-polyprenyl-1,4-benzoquinol methylase
MQSKYLSNDAQRAPKVREMFSRIARRYDLVNDLMSFGMHRRWKQETVRAAFEGARRPRSLDLCCGSGDLSFLAEAMGASRVTGADFALPMLAVARERKLAIGSRSAFVQADALRLPFPNATFDVVTIGYGLRNVADLPAALAEIRRVLVPGGCLAALDFGKPDGRLASALYSAYLRAAMPAIGWIFHGDPDTYLYIPASLERYPGQRGVERLMREAGFEKARHEDRVFGMMGINLGEAPGPRDGRG